MFKIRSKYASYAGLPAGKEVKNPPASPGDIRDIGLIPRLGRARGHKATHSTILAWRIPWTEEPGRLQSMGLQRVATEEARLTTVNIEHFML